ncbi:MAG: hypothetical protein A2Y67_01385 [Candidatus Buchananbacteria bacterium RBG_13_39_9]|uniref:Thioredoxin domain-containing protein n=1 Tax=Candidatus Buchananbacteria bacterium RBG_13_39_9 TaxID=1797531 RepID=A0A1G1XTR6_9BACT|nr:MAG: hypothetical protein A2Y67_01385 [Candidatus Buchananbacteria bacterium RBG_13_39_9]
MAQEERTKRWHQRWWGIIILLGLAIFLFFFAIFIYQFVDIVASQTEIISDNLKLSQQLSQNNTDLLNRKLIESTDDPSLGPAEAKIIIVEFADFQCPYCKEAYPIVRRLHEIYPKDVKIIFRDFPNTSDHPDALNSALAANCAADQGKFWEMHDLIFANQSNLSAANLSLLISQLGLDLNQYNQCFSKQKYTNEIFNDLQDGIKLDVSGTPTFFINGVKVPGVISLENFKQVIDKFLQQQK